MTFNAFGGPLAHFSISCLTDTTKVLMSLCSIFFVSPLDEENKASGMNCHLLHCVMKSWCVSHFRRHITCNFFALLGFFQKLANVIAFGVWFTSANHGVFFTFAQHHKIDDVNIRWINNGRFDLEIMKSALQWFLIE